MAKFIVFEGIDGSGKTTQIKMLRETLCARGIPCDVTREPTEGDIGKLLRDCLTGKKKTDPKAIAALFAADRLDHITREGGILDTLDSGVTLLCDRYYLSSYAYQSVDCTAEWVMELNRQAAALAKPDLHIFLDLPAEQSMERVTSRGETELFEELEKQKQIRERFFELFEALSDSENIVVIDGTRSPEEIAEDVLKKVLEIL